MKKVIITLLVIFSGLTLFAQAFLVYKKNERMPDVHICMALDSVYFSVKGDTVLEYFATPEGVFSYNVSDIDHISFLEDYYIKAVRHNYVIPKDGCRIRVRSVFSLPRESGRLMANVSKDFWYSGTEITSDSTLIIPINVDHEIFNGRISYESGSQLDSILHCYSDTIYVKQSGNPYFINGFPDGIIVDPFKNTELRIAVNPEITPKPIIKTDCDWAWVKYENDSTLVVNIDENQGGERGFYLNFDFRDINSFMFDLGGGELRIRQLRKVYHTAEEHRAALMDLYDKCNGTEWKMQENWGSEKPLWEWDHVNKDELGLHKTDRVRTLVFGGGQFSGLAGDLPESFAVIMDDAEVIDLRQSAITSFPYNVRHHERWDGFGWNFIHQSIWHGGGEIDYSDINLKLNDYKLFDYREGRESTVYEELAKNKLTLVCHAALDPTSEDYATLWAPEFMNLYLDYQPQGLGMVFVRDPFSYNKVQKDDPEYTAAIERFESKEGLKDIIWTNSFGNKVFGVNDGILVTGSMMLFDGEGNLIWNGDRDWSVSPVWYISKMEPIFRERLGEPVEHDPYVPNMYTSTDFSRDGEVQTLQTATVGKGINVVFIGDGFTDKDIAEEDGYEEIMRNGMEQLFSVEPLKSLRDRFNVYSIITVSPNRFVSNGTQAINKDPNKVAEYLKPLGIDMETTHVCLIENKENLFFESGYTSMFSAGGSLAIIDQGLSTDIIVHETGGHGIGKLLDEYISSGYENNSVQPGYEESFKEWINSEYHSRGWGMNVSATDNPEEVPWAHMLNDDYFSAETGIYQGAWMWPVNLWRPSENGVMNRDYSHFNAPSREAIYKYVMKESEGESWTYDFETFKEFDKSTQPKVESTQTPQVIKQNTIRGGVRVHSQSRKSNPVRKIEKVNDRYEILPVVPPFEGK